MRWLASAEWQPAAEIARSQVVVMIRTLLSILSLIVIGVVAGCATDQWLHHEVCKKRNGHVHAKHIKPGATPNMKKRLRRPALCAPLYELEEHEPWFECMGVGYRRPYAQASAK